MKVLKIRLLIIPDLLRFVVDQQRFRDTAMVTGWLRPISPSDLSERAPAETCGFRLYAGLAGKRTVMFQNFQIILKIQTSKSQIR